jgi:uncharacterized protein
MVTKIDKDVGRFKRIIRGKVRENLKKYITQGEMMGKQGKDIVSIPIPQIDIPHFKLDGSKGGGVGSGEGEEGDPVGGEEGQGQGSGKAGDQEGQHALEVELTFDELVEIMAEELELPRIEPRGSEDIQSMKGRYRGITHVGPNSLRHFKRSYKEALQRQIAAGEYDPDDPIIVPIRQDLRFRYRQMVPEPLTNAVIILMMDVSGSMEEEQKEIVRITSFWIDTWLRTHYKGLKTRYIVHDTVAQEVDKDTFFRMRESGGTVISSAYKMCAKMIADEYPSDQWNIYPFHFSDGDNWSERDNEESVKIIREQLLPACNLFCYGQVESRYGSGKFIKELTKHFAEEEKISLVKIENKDAIIKGIKTFLSTGK